MFISKNYPGIYTKSAELKPDLPSAKNQQENFCNDFSHIAQYPVSFGTLYRDKTLKNKPEGNELDITRHETHFFRDKETLQAVAEYIKKNFPNGTNIADFGCSKGEEAFSLAMFLDKANPRTTDGKHLYNITGYDIDEDIVKSAQNRAFVIYNFKMSKDSFLLKKLNNCKFEEMPYAKLFSRYFEGTEKPQDEIIDEFIKSMSKITEDTTHKHKYFKVRENALPYVDFKTGNINEIDKINLDNTGVIIFKNAWYHLIGRADAYRPYEDTEENLDAEISRIRGKYNEVVEKINKKLPINGILVTGSLARDHVASIKNKRNQSIILKGEPILDQVLLANGFIPLKKEHTFIPRKSEYMPDKQITVATIWKKISDI